jgi:glycosyltransferase involved in cell wall biosynthesis
MYVGNLETYQGADLMLEGFGVFLKKGGKGRLVIAGGKAEDILKYRAKSATMGIHGQVQFLGPQPLGRMAALFEAADILLSPRIKGNNTPMKIYSYLASGKAILATALPTHTQVLTDEVARLVPPDPVAFGEAMLQLAENATLRTTLGRTAGTLAEHAYSPAAFHQTVSALYDWVEEERTP